jgi:hypothetical protein
MEIEIRVRWAAILALLVRAQELLAVRGYTGAPAPLTLRLREGAGLTVEATANGATDAYAFQDLGRPDMTEILETARPDVRLRAEVRADKLVLQRWTTGAAANVWAILNVGKDGWWEGEVETTTLPGGQRARRPLLLIEARDFLSDALRELLRVRARFGLTHGRDLSAFRLP